MKRKPEYSLFLILILANLISHTFSIRTAHAFEIPPGPDRYMISEEAYVKYVWWLVRWVDNIVVCEIIIDHPGSPDNGEIFDTCERETYDDWIKTQICEESYSDPDKCFGYYLHLIDELPATRLISVQLAPPTVWLSLDGCIPYASTHRCEESPMLVLSGDEPLSGHSILRLEGTIGDEPFVCDPICQIELIPTSDKGEVLKFWAYSSYGDTSEVLTALIRVQEGLFPDDLYTYVDIISDQWRGAPQAPCMDIWSVFPPVGGLHNWLSTPETPKELASSYPYEYLAGSLILHGGVDASSCLDGGLLDSGYASPCGSEIARDKVVEWQNRFDEEIHNSALEVGIPAQLLKNLFSRESQFWPGIISGRYEAGLGQMTKNGADTTFLWNTPFYEQFCIKILGKPTCDKGYANLSEQDRLLLQEALVKDVDAFCEDCPLGIDIEKASRSISIFANSILANCAQANMVISLNYTANENSPLYEDLWKFTLINYNAGSGCLGLAVDRTNTLGEPLDWESVSLHLTPACENALDYVEDISKSSP